MRLDRWLEVARMKLQLNGHVGWDESSARATVPFVTASLPPFDFLKDVESWLSQLSELFGIALPTPTFMEFWRRRWRRMWDKATPVNDPRTHTIASLIRIIVIRKASGENDATKLYQCPRSSFVAATNSRLYT